MTIQLTADTSQIDCLLSELTPDLIDRFTELFRINGELIMAPGTPEFRVTFEATDGLLDLIAARVNRVGTGNLDTNLV